MYSLVALVARPSLAGRRGAIRDPANQTEEAFELTAIRRGETIEDRRGDTIDLDLSGNQTLSALIGDRRENTSPVGRVGDPTHQLVGRQAIDQLSNVRLYAAKPLAHDPEGDRLAGLNQDLENGQLWQREAIPLERRVDSFVDL